MSAGRFSGMLSYMPPLIMWGGVAFILLALKEAVVPLVGGFVLAYLLSPIIRVLVRAKCPRWLAVWVVFCCMMAILISVSVFVLPGIVMEIFHFLENGPRYLTRSYYQLMVYLSKNGFGHIVWRYNLLPILQRMGNQYVDGLVGSFTSSAQSFTTQLSATASSIVNASLFPIFFYYGLARIHLLPGEILRIVPMKYHSSVTYFLSTCDKICSGYIRGQLIVCICLGTLYSIGLWGMGIPYALVIGYISGFLNLVPYLGFAGGISIGVLTVLISGGSITGVLSVLCVFIVAQTIESFILTPKIVGSTVGLDPLLTLIALIAGGNLFGVGGLLVAVPVAGIVNRIYKDYLNNTLSIAPLGSHGAS